MAMDYDCNNIIKSFFGGLLLTVYLIAKPLIIYENRIIISYIEIFRFMRHHNKFFVIFLINFKRLVR